MFVQKVREVASEHLVELITKKIKDLNRKKIWERMRGLIDRLIEKLSKPSPLFARDLPSLS